LIHSPAGRNTLRAWRFLTSLCLALLVAPLWHSVHGLVPEPVFEDFQPPDRNVSGISYDGHSLWMTIDGKGVLYELDPLTFNVRRKLEFPEKETGGSAWDGRHLWQLAWRRKKLYEVDLHEGKIVSVQPTPGMGMCSGMTFDGRYLWIANFEDKKIYQIDQRHGGRILNALDGAHESAGLAWDGRFLWTGLVVGASSDDEPTPYSGFIEQRDLISGRSLMALPVNGVGPGGTDWLPGQARASIHWWYDGYHNKIVRIRFRPATGALISCGAQILLACCLLGAKALVWRTATRESAQLARTF
jgi:hypothetical protein